MIFQSIKGLNEIKTINPFSIYLEACGNNYLVLGRQEYLPIIKVLNIVLVKSGKNLVQIGYLKSELVNIYGDDFNPLIRSYSFTNFDRLFQNYEQISLNLEINFDITGRFTITSLKLTNNLQIELKSNMILINSLVDRNENFIIDLSNIEENFYLNEKILVDLNFEIKELEKSTNELKNKIGTYGIGENYYSKLEEITSFILNKELCINYEFTKTKLLDYKFVLENIKETIETNYLKIRQNIINDLEYSKLADTFIKQLQTYEKIIDEEYIKIFHSINSRITKISINKASEILIRYQIISNTINNELGKSLKLTYSKEDINLFLNNMKKEFSLLFDNSI